MMQLIASYIYVTLTAHYHVEHINVKQRWLRFVSRIAWILRAMRDRRFSFSRALNERETSETHRLKSWKSREVNSVSPSLSSPPSLLRRCRRRRRRRRHPTAITPLCEFARFAYFRKRCTGKHKQLRLQRERCTASS